MAIAFVQKSTELFADAATTIAPSLAAVTAGNLVVMLIAVSVNAANTALAAPAGWSTAQIPAAAGAGAFRPSIGIFYKRSSAGGTETGTVNLVAGSYAAGSIIEFSGFGGVCTYIDSNFNTATTGTSGNSNSAGCNEFNIVALVIGHADDGVGATSNFSTPATTGYTSIDTEATNAVHIAYDFSYLITTARGEQSGAWTWTTSSPFCNGVVVFAPVTPVSTGAGV